MIYGVFDDGELRTAIGLNYRGKLHRNDHREMILVRNLTYFAKTTVNILRNIYICASATHKSNF